MVLGDQPMTENYFASSILAGLLLIVMLGGMRAFYGCWPWEYSKTWYRTEKEIARLDALIWPSVRRPVSANTEEAPTMRNPISESADTGEAPTMPNPIADALREKIAEDYDFVAQLAEDRLRQPPATQRGCEARKQANWFVVGKPREKYSGFSV